MCHTAEMHFESNVAKTELRINQQFFYAFNSLDNNILFDGIIFLCRKNIAK